MVGQGSPHTAPATSQRFVGRRSCAIFRLLPGLVYLCALFVTQSFVAAQDTDLRLRIAWGGGESRQWRAVISVSEGEFSEPVPLGLEADVPGSIEVLGNQVRLTQRSPRTYDGIDILVNASLDATLSVVLSPRDHKTEPYRESIKLSKLIKEYHTAPIDDRKNTLLVRRAPGDRLRLLFNRDHLVFWPGEGFSLNVIPHHVGLEPKTSFTCRVGLRKGRTTEVLSILIYKSGLQFFQIGQASAMSWIFLLFIFFISIFFIRELQGRSR